MNMEDVTFDSFMSLPHKMRKQILNDPDAIKILIRKNLKKKRYDHSLSVADMARDLARCHHVDENKA